MSALQILALLAGIMGLGATIGATVSNEWKSTSRASSVITATWVYQGLWMNCAGNAIGAVHCRRHHTIFKLEPYVQACRGLMISALGLGFLASVCGLVGMKCTKIGGSDQLKSRITGFAGFLFFLSGLCSLTGCSVYANRVTFDYYDPRFADQKYELGSALFIGWAGSVLCLLGGLVFFLSAFCSLHKQSSNYSERRRYGYSATTYVSSPERIYKQSSVGKRPPTEQSNTSKNFDRNAYV